MGESTIIASGYLSYLKTALFQMDNDTHARFWDYVRGPCETERPLTLSEKAAYFDRTFEHHAIFSRRAIFSVSNCLGSFSWVSKFYEFVYRILPFS